MTAEARTRVSTAVALDQWRRAERAAAAACREQATAADAALRAMSDACAAAATAEAARGILQAVAILHVSAQEAAQSTASRAAAAAAHRGEAARRSHEAELHVAEMRARYVAAVEAAMQKAGDEHDRTALAAPGTSGR